MPLVSLYTPRKNQKTRGLLMFSGGIERKRGMKWINPFIIHFFHRKKLGSNNFHATLRNA